MFQALTMASSSQYSAVYIASTSLGMPSLRHLFLGASLTTRGVYLILIRSPKANLLCQATYTAPSREVAADNIRIRLIPCRITRLQCLIGWRFYSTMKVAWVSLDAFSLVPLLLPSHNISEERKKKKETDTHLRRICTYAPLQI